MIQCTIRYVSSLAFMYVLLSTVASSATTIQPFANIGTLSLDAQEVLVVQSVSEYEYREGHFTFFRTDLKVLQSIKGKLLPGNVVTVQKWGRKEGDFQRIMFGDIHLEPGSTFLVFLNPAKNGLFQPICFQYYIFQKITFENQYLWQPSMDQDQFQLMDSHQAEPLTYYQVEKLEDHLRSIVQGRENWDKEKVVSHADVSSLSFDGARAAPSHCGFIGTTTNYRWLGFPDQPVAVHYQSGGDADCSSSISFVQQAINLLNTEYTGISLTDGGPFSGFVPGCGNSVQGTNLPTFTQSQWGDSRHTLIQFDDPCDAIDDLTDCGGTLAVGGLYGSGSHSYDGATWYDGGYGYVVVNNGVGSCLCTANTYGLMLTHELTHTLGLGHIPASSGLANMNPLCCNDIQQLDIDCVEYLYPPSTLLPVELLSFSADEKEISNEIIWETTNESEVEAFLVEKADPSSPQGFEKLGRITPQLNLDENKRYVLEDLLPDMETHYRLQTLNLDGSKEYSTIIYRCCAKIRILTLFTPLWRCKVFRYSEVRSQTIPNLF